MAGLRPTPSKVRQALFNILGPIDGFTMLDLFSGSGIMSLEALSRGVDSVLSIEQNRKLTKTLSNIRTAWGLESGWQIQSAPVEKGLANLYQQSFDLIFADPPYQQGFAEKLPGWLDQFEIACGQLIIEESSHVKPHWPEGWRHEQSRCYGDTTLYFLSRLS